MASVNLCQELLTAVSANNTTGPAVNCQGMSNFKVYTIANGTVTSGAVTIEEAYINPADTAAGYTGTWKIVGSAITVATTGTQTATALTVSAYSHLRARITTIVGGGGTVTVALVGSQ